MYFHSSATFFSFIFLRPNKGSVGLLDSEIKFIAYPASRSRVKINYLRIPPSRPGKLGSVPGVGKYSGSRIHLPLAYEFHCVSPKLIGSLDENIATHFPHWLA